MDTRKFAEEFEAVRKELTGYLSRLVVRPQVAEDLVQTTFLRSLEAIENAPDEIANSRAWFFRVATNLAFDELRRHSSWRENMMPDLRELAENDPGFVAHSIAMAGTPETKAIAREHLVACFACVLRNLPERKAAAFLLKEVHGFKLAEVAGLLGTSEGQAKNWLQEARSHMDARYSQTCALLNKQGVCYQCVELDEFFGAGQGNPLGNTNGDIEARTQILKDMRDQQYGAWHKLLFELLDDLA
ncbi:MAG: RNA polymerase sigma factor [Nitrosomonadales bacterium]|nr:RNA polymerase sigma factor [Nitrosomonadales bacterium]